MSAPRTAHLGNETRLVQALFRGGPMSRAGLARALGLTRATAGILVSTLITEGVVIAIEKGESRKIARTGRPGDDVQLNPNYAIFVGADIGVNQLTVVALDFNATVLIRRSQPLASAHPESKQVIRQLAKLVGNVTNKLNADQIVRGLAVTIPGLLNHDGDVLRTPILGWRDVKLMALLRTHFKTMRTIQVENDANAAAFAELYRSKEEVPGDAVYLFLDVGVGGGVFSRGELVTGHNGYAGELGHILVGEKGFGPILTLKGSLESYVGRDAILSRYQHYCGGHRDLDVLIGAFRNGEKAALATFDDCVHYLARALATLTTVLNPEKFVLGGQVASFFALDAEKLRARIQEYLLPGHPVPELSFSPLGSDGPAVGAACILHHGLLTMDRRESS